MNATQIASQQRPLVYRLAELEKAIGLFKTTIYEQIQAGTFPEPVELTAKTVGWRVDEVQAWLKNRSRRRIRTGDDSG